MSKAEKLAEIKYPIHSVLFVPARGGGYYADKHLREGFITGYHQAEKDLELGWEDIKVIFLLVQAEWTSKKTDKEIYQEVLERFNEKRKK